MRLALAPKAVKVVEDKVVEDKVVDGAPGKQSSDVTGS
jgi:hypothetical protein